jgi:PAS domain-containing protein
MSRLATLLEHRYDTLVPGPADHVAPLHEHLRAALQTLVAALRSDPRPIDVPAPGDLDPDQLLRAHAELRRHILDLVDAEDLALTPAELRAFSEFTTDAITDATTRRARHPQGEPLPASETRLQLVTDALPILVSFVTADERYALVNRAYEHWFGLPREQLLGRTLLEARWSGSKRRCSWGAVIAGPALWTCKVTVVASARVSSLSERACADIQRILKAVDRATRLVRACDAHASSDAWTHR